MSKFHEDYVQGVPPALKGFEDFAFTPMSVSDTVETSIYLSCTLLQIHVIWILVQYHLNYKLTKDQLYCNIKGIY